jgi:hypothetical protein
VNRDAQGPLRGVQGGYGGHGEVLGHHGGGQAHHRNKERDWAMTARFVKPNYEKDRHLLGYRRGVLGQVGVPGGVHGHQGGLQVQVGLLVVPQHGLGPLHDVRTTPVTPAWPCSPL